MFRPDGLFNHRFIDGVRSPRLLASLSVVNPKIPISICHVPAPSESKRSSSVILFLRQSNGEQEEGLARQLWSILTSPFEGTFPLLDNTQLCIAVEVCSSSMHPYDDRPLLSRVLKRSKGPFTILTANPDRMTRPKEDVQPIIAQLQRRQGRWITRACQGDEFESSEWYNVEDVQPEAENQILQGKKHGICNLLAAREKGRELTLQRAFYVRFIAAVTRLLVAPATKSLYALHDVLNLTFDIHKIETVVLYCRVSPRDADRQDESQEVASIERQSAFLQRLCPLRSFALRLFFCFFFVF